ncbi:YhcN/YlaJ family sporulation lipoprotein [Brockia lithotrophica]|uniref:Sporulation lipoprotein YhcN/YlaJ n=1 Tax=Brockia lithotrophica TaxID=933949 RepID=A0A660L0C0_9BACL|nr:YhcN/YlaJ family sporulation lipoprotein [Brockia lithotrophica]RKQ83860.1 sporulation lipoprotein YhcN/YlaJ [Brockia lithotrophica]
MKRVLRVGWAGLFLSLALSFGSGGCAAPAPGRPTSEELPAGPPVSAEGRAPEGYGFTPLAARDGRASRPSGVSPAGAMEASELAAQVAQEAAGVQGVTQVEALAVGRTVFVGVAGEEGASERVRAHLASRFPRVDVRVTGDPDLVRRIETLAERVRSGENPRALYPEFDALGRALPAGTF